MQAEIGRDTASFWSILRPIMLVLVFLPALIAHGDVAHWSAVPRVMATGALSGIAAGLAVFGLLTLSGIQPRASRPFDVIYLWLFLSGVFVPIGVSRLDGTPLSARWHAFSIAAVLAFAALPVLLFYASWGRDLLFRRLAIAVDAVWLAGSVWLLADVMVRAPSEVEASSPHSVDELGSGDNVIVLIMDMLPGALLERTIELHPELASDLDGFTFFTRATSTYPLTNYSLPQIMSGKVFASADSRPDFLANIEASRRDSFVQDALARGYQAGGLASIGGLPDRHFLWQSTYLDDDGRQQAVTGRLLEALHLDEYTQLLLATGYRLTGFPFLESRRLDPMYEMKRDLLAAWRRWRARMTIGPAADNILVVHSMLPHVPFLYQADGSEGRSLPWSFATATDELYFVVREMGRTFARLRELGAFDRSMIIVAGDHGHLICSDLDPGQGAENLPGGNISGGNYRPACMFNPAILIKPQGARGLTLTQAPAGIGDIREIIRMHLDGRDRGISASDLVRAARDLNGPIPTVVICRQRSDPHYQSTDFEFIHSEGNVTELPGKFERACRGGAS